MTENGFRVTYATMSADDDGMHEAYDRGIEEARTWVATDPQHDPMNRTPISRALTAYSAISPRESWSGSSPSGNSGNAVKSGCSAVVR